MQLAISLTNLLLNLLSRYSYAEVTSRLRNKGMNIFDVTIVTRA